jgi:hypothetical protein
MTSAQENLQNLQKIGKLKPEPPNQVEFDGLLRSAKRKLPDSENETLSADSRFILAYDAAHSLALAALRWHGFRSENRYIVFQAPGHTVSFPTEKWRFLDHCHHKRNVALYEGENFEDEQLIKDLIAVTRNFQAAVEALGAIDS